MHHMEFYDFDDTCSTGTPSETWSSSTWDSESHIPISSYSTLTRALTPQVVTNNTRESGVLEAGLPTLTIATVSVLFYFRVFH